MPRRKIDSVLDPLTVPSVETAFKTLYGGSDDNWDWLQRKLRGMDPDVLKRSCKRVTEEPDPTDLLVLDPCYVFGHLDLGNTTAWEAGLTVGRFFIFAVVHEECARAYYARRVAELSEDEQDL